ncbi:MAG: type II toxin-antitoxin system RelE/ParE family toxin [Beijerinckiaceae bacterium]
MTGSASRYELTPEALADLADIWAYGAAKWSPDQADRYTDELAHVFETLVTMPGMARERTEFVPPVRIHVHGSHLVVYVLAGNVVSVIRVLGGRQDWRAILNCVDG